MDLLRLLNNRYQLTSQLGKGGMAFVYKARDQMLERDVAIKLLRDDYSHSPAFLERFRQEAKASANLSHPNIVTIHDFGMDGGQIYIVMEFVPGVDLKTLIQKRGRFRPEEALPLMIQACAGIGYAHRAGLVHCDVKPQNLLVTPDGRLKVTDFGIARALATIRPDEQSDIVWGSPQYFAPEQAAGGAPSPASDVYSLGVVMYEMLTGSLPFQSTSASVLARMHLESDAPLLTEMVPGISPTLERILVKVLSKEPSQRYRTADQLGRVLMNFGDVRKTPALALTPETAEAEAGPTVQRPQEGRTGKTQPVAARKQDAPGLGIDWVSVGLGLLALVAGLGLIPFWLWVYYVYNPVR
jgi:serine/threonine-protein kinase